MAKHRISRRTPRRTPRKSRRASRRASKRTPRKSRRTPRRTSPKKTPKRTPLRVSRHASRHPRHASKKHSSMSFKHRTPSSKESSAKKIARMKNSMKKLRPFGSGSCKKKSCGTRSPSPVMAFHHSGLEKARKMGKKALFGMCGAGGGSSKAAPSIPVPKKGWHINSLRECMHCIEAKKYFKEHGIKFTLNEYGMTDGTAPKGGDPYYPQIFYNGEKVEDYKSKIAELGM